MVLNVENAAKTVMLRKQWRAATRTEKQCASDAHGAPFLSTRVDSLVHETSHMVYLLSVVCQRRYKAHPKCDNTHSSSSQMKNVSLSSDQYNQVK